MKTTKNNNRKLFYISYVYDCNKLRLQKFGFILRSTLEIYPNLQEIKNNIKEIVVQEEAKKGDIIGLTGKDLQVTVLSIMPISREEYKTFIN